MPSAMQQPGEAQVYMSVKDAIRELQVATLYARTHVRPTVRLPPVSPPLPAARTCVTSSVPGSYKGLPKMGADPAATCQQSMTSSVSGTSPRPPHTAHGALGGSMKSGLNHPSTYHYGEDPLKPILAGDNRYSKVGSYSMFGSQALSERTSSGAFGFGTATRERWGKTYISPAHLKDLYGHTSPSPDTYTLQSSLGRQVINSRTTYPARSFGIEDRFDADRRDRRAAVTPGPGAYRI